MGRVGTGAFPNGGMPGGFAWECAKLAAKGRYGNEARPSRVPMGGS